MVTLPHLARTHNVFDKGTAGREVMFYMLT
jgi:hypothetical protein